MLFPDSLITINGIIQDIISWQTDRAISGAGVPGQARTRTGNLAGTATFELLNPDGEPFRATQKVGQPATVDATIDTATMSFSRIFTGETDSASGQASLPTLSVEAIDAIRKDRPLTLPISADISGSDMSMLISQAAQTLGYYAWPQDATLRTIPLHGNRQSYTTARWVSHKNRIIADLSTSGAQILASGLVEFELGATRTITVAVDCLQNETHLDKPLTVHMHGAQIDLISVGHHTYNAGSVFKTMGDQPLAFETQFERTSASIVSARGRLVGLTDGLSSGWSNWVTFTYAPEQVAVIHSANVGAPLWGIAWATIREGVVGDANFKPTAVIDHAGFTLDAVIVEKQESAWRYLQSITQQVMGASGVDEDGIFRFWGKQSLRTGQSSETIGIDGLADIPWTISRDDIADRVEVTFTAPDIITSGHNTVWEASEVLQVNAGRTRTIPYTLEGVGARYFRDFQRANSDPVESTGSRWIAFTTREGSSPLPDDDALQIVVESSSWSAGRLRITNRTSQTLWIRDHDGGPALFLRAEYVARMGESETVSVGASEDDARTPFTVDGGASIQRFGEAQDLAAWLYAVLSEPLPVIESVSVNPDFRRRIGQIVTIYDPGLTGIRSKALIYGVHNSHSTQTLDLALLAVTIDDAMQYAEKLAPAATTLGELFDAVDAATPSTSTLQEFIDAWETESVEI